MNTSTADQSREKKPEVTRDIQPKKRNLWPWVWLGLLATGLAVEGVAIALPGEDDTLSEQVWNLVDFLKGAGLAGKVGLAFFTMGVLGFFGWLGLHFFTRKV